MSKSFLSLAVLAFLSIGAAAQPAPSFLSELKPTRSLLLYPKGQDSGEGIVENGVAITLGAGENNGLSGGIVTKPGIREANIGDEAYIDLYLPEDCNGQMIVCSPGGGYAYVSAENEGLNVARWCVANRIALCVVHYRLPNKHCTVPLTDMQNAFRYCRAHASEWGVRQIGVMGFSAGGHLAGSTSVLYVDKITRPDFSVLIYPVIDLDPQITHGGTSFNLTGGNPKLMKYYSLQYHITADTPRTLLVLSSDDTTVNPENSIRYFQKCKEHGVPVEMYLFPCGGHGWGFNIKELGEDRLESHRSEFFSILKKFLDSSLQQAK